MESKISYKKQTGFTTECDSQGYLFSEGKYRTKILPQDLPEWYVYGYLYKRHGYISAKSVKYLVYVPNYVFNHRHKDDLLYISYGTEIESYQDDSKCDLYQGYDYMISGPLIVDFIEAVGKFSNYDISEIQQEITRKQAWYDERNAKQ